MITFSSYFDTAFLVLFLPVSVAVYMLLPRQNLRRVWLLLCSLFFFWCDGKGLLVFILLSTLFMHHGGLWLGRLQGELDAALTDLPKEEKKAVRERFKKRKRLVLAFFIALELGMLAVLKYAGFFVNNLNGLMGLFSSGTKFIVPHFLLPMGISFYTMQAMSYLFDVYRGKLAPDTNIGRLLLYMSFFPNIMEGPICRWSDTAESLWNAERVTYERLTRGAQRILWGMVKKIVIADRLNPFVQNVFGGYDVMEGADLLHFDFTAYPGWVVALASAAFTLQLYAEFSGTMDLALGLGEIFGVHTPENFQRPFFSLSISEFWKRWHITLGTWFRDYVFYPVSISAPVKKLTTRARKKLGNRFGPLAGGAVALFAVWIFNGLWHGAGWNYIFFGMYHFTLILLGNIADVVMIRFSEKTGFKRDILPVKLFRILRTTLLVVLGELFFRAPTLTQGFAMCARIFTRFVTKQTVSRAAWGIDIKDAGIVVVTAVIMLVVGLLQEKGKGIRERVAEKPVVLRYLFWYAVVLFLVVFGAYGAGYIPVDPMYAEF
jgi:D-alanyl-lipoteichoic acid acyltransferase DltB (MBOAT superfamily)